MRKCDVERDAFGRLNSTIGESFLCLVLLDIFKSLLALKVPSRGMNEPMVNAQWIHGYDHWK